MRFRFFSTQSVPLAHRLSSAQTIGLRRGKGTIPGSVKFGACTLSGNSCQLAITGSLDEACASII